MTTTTTTSERAGLWADRSDEELAKILAAARTSAARHPDGSHERETALSVQRKVLAEQACRNREALGRADLSAALTQAPRP